MATLFIGLLMPGSRCVRAQASGTASQQMRLFAYGTGTLVRPFSYSTFQNYGATVGATLNAFSFGRAELGVDARISGTHGSAYNQALIRGGPRLQYDLGRFQPYVAFHVGYGSIHFNQSSDPAYTSDSSAVFGMAGGLDYRLSRSWALRVESDWQRWRIDAAQQPFHPAGVSVGVRYQFHFRNGHGPE